MKPAPDSPADTRPRHGRLSPGSLRTRFERRLLWRLVVLFLLSGALSYGITRYYVSTVYDHWLYDSANSLAQSLRLIGNSVDLDLPRTAQSMFQWDDEDQTVYRITASRAGYIAGITQAPAEPARPDRFRNARLFDASFGGERMRWAAVDVQLVPEGERVSVLVGETTRKRRRLAGEILLAVWIPQFALLLMAAWVTRRVLARQSGNILSLSEALRDLSHRSLKPVPEGSMPDELHPLVEALNAVIAKLERAGAAQRQFIANAAHQLRTPLTALKLQAEQALRADDLSSTRQSLHALRRSAERAVRLANQLLLLSRAEPEAQSASNRDRVDLQSLAFEASREWVSRALASRIDLGFAESSVPAWAVVDQALLREAVNNLLDNAIKHCPAGTRIQVGAERSHGAAAIVVEDSGPGIAEPDRERVTRRFHRGDTATAEGSGLGLAIVSEIASAHGGRLLISRSALGGARFDILLPAEPEAAGP